MLRFTNCANQSSHDDQPTAQSDERRWGDGESVLRRCQGSTGRLGVVLGDGVEEEVRRGVVEKESTDPSYAQGGQQRSPRTPASSSRDGRDPSEGRGRGRKAGNRTASYTRGPHAGRVSARETGPAQWGPQVSTPTRVRGADGAGPPVGARDRRLGRAGWMGEWAESVILGPPGWSSLLFF